MSLPSSYLSLTRIQRGYVDGRLAGLTQIASAAAAGCTDPRSEGSRLEKNENVQAAMVAMMEKSAEEVGFGRKEAHDMYMDAYTNAETATEQIAAVNAMVKLHGLEKPKEVVVQHNHSHTGKIEHMPTDELMKLAGMDSVLAIEGEYEEVEPKPKLAPPEVTDDNVENPKEVRRVPDGY